MFFGGWMPLHIPGWDAFNHIMDYIPSVVWFLGKAIALSFIIIWFKWTFPRLRIDHLLALEWKYLLPTQPVQPQCLWCSSSYSICTFNNK